MYDNEFDHEQQQFVLNRALLYLIKHCPNGEVELPMSIIKNNPNIGAIGMYFDVANNRIVLRANTAEEARAFRESIGQEFH